MPALARSGVARPAHATTLLYVDDRSEDRLLFAQAARSANVSFQLQLLAGYYEVIDYLRGHDSYADRASYPLPTLIVLDYDLVNFRAVDILRWLVAEKDYAPLPVMILSGTADPAKVASCYALGARAYLLKPNHPEDLRDIVERLDACLQSKPLNWAQVREISICKPPGSGNVAAGVED